LSNCNERNTPVFRSRNVTSVHQLRIALAN
jgi:hypothetical protein